VTNIGDPCLRRCGERSCWSSYGNSPPFSGEIELPTLASR